MQSRVLMTTITLQPRPLSSDMAPVAGDRARDVLIHDANAQPFHLADLWVGAPRAVILVFLRQYGCPLCREKVASLRHQFAAFLAEGVTIAAIGQGTPEDARRFREQLDLSFPVLSDAQRSAYAAYGLRDGTMEQVFSPKLALRLANAVLHGHLPHRTVGSIWQLPGVFVIDRNGIVRIAHPGHHAADTPEIGSLLSQTIAAVPDQAPPL